MNDAADSTSRVLVVDDDPEVVEFVRRLGRRHLFEVSGAGSIAQALEQAREAPPDSVLIDLHLGAGESGLDLPAQLRALPGLQAVPMGFLSSDDSIASRIAASKAGAAVYLLKPADAEQLALVLHQLVAMGSAEPPQILLASTDLAAIGAIRATLEDAGMVISTCAHAETLQARLSEVRPDLLLIDDAIPPVGALDACRLVRTLPRWQDLHVMLMMEPTDNAARAQVRAAGGDEWLTRPVGTAELLDKVGASVNRVRRMRERYDRDPLTGLPLRRAFLDQAGIELEGALARGEFFMIAMLDLDHFKRINDRYGHRVGDAVLARFGRVVQARLRPQDLRSRWGGEEFCLAFSGDCVTTARASVERLLAEFSLMRMSDDLGRKFNVSFSAGLSVAPREGRTIESLLHRADERLYEAKRGGRSRIVGGLILT